MRGRRLARPPARERRGGPNVNTPAKKGAGGDDHGARAEAASLERFNADYAIAVEQQACHSPLHCFEKGMLLDEHPYRSPVQTTVALSAWRPYRWSLAPIEHPELQRGHISGACHDAAKRIDFAHDGTFCYAANCRVARHLTDRFQRAGHERRARAAPRCRHRRLCPRVAGTDDQHVELGFEGREGKRHSER